LSSAAAGTKNTGTKTAQGALNKSSQRISRLFILCMKINICQEAARKFPIRITPILCLAFFEACLILAGVAFVKGPTGRRPTPACQWRADVMTAGAAVRYLLEPEQPGALVFASNPPVERSGSDILSNSSDANVIRTPKKSGDGNLTNGPTHS
jgi:hypothetical protein